MNFRGRAEKISTIQKLLGAAILIVMTDLAYVLSAFLMRFTCRKHHSGSMYSCSSWLLSRQSSESNIEIKNVDTVKAPTVQIATTLLRQNNGMRNENNISIAPVLSRNLLKFSDLFLWYLKAKF